DKMASLNGACMGPPASLITFLVGCMVTCENAPRTVIIPATAKTTTRKLMRRFILCLPSNDPPTLPRECNIQKRLRQAIRQCSAPCPASIFIPECDVFTLERNNSHSNEVQRCEPNS